MLRIHSSATLGVLLALAACQPATEAGPCRCTPENVARTKQLGESQPIDRAGLLARLRRHRLLVEQHANGRDIKLLDDEIRIAVASFCQPCGDWVGERLTVDEMFPIKRLDDATGAICLGLVMRDGAIAFGDARPAACRL